MSYCTAVRFPFVIFWIAVVILAAGLADVPVEASGNDYLSDLLTWRSEVEERLKAEDGWLTIAGLFWLTEGKHRFGSGAENDFVLPGRPRKRSAPFH